MPNLGIQCVIAAGGRGTRLLPLTERIPKPMVPVLGVPFLHWLIAHLVSQGIHRFVVLTGYHAHKIVKYFGDGEKLGCEILYSYEDKPLGSGGALWAARELLEEEFLYVNGDDYPEINYAELIRAFHQRNVLAMVAVCRDPDGHFAVDEKTGCVLEYSLSGGLPYLDCGTKVFRKEVLDLMQPEPPFTLEPTLWPTLITQKQLVIFPLQSRPHAIDTVESLRVFEGWLRQRYPKLGRDVL